MRTNIYLDDVSNNVARELPRKVSTSALVRWMLKAIEMNDKEWKKAIKEDASLREAHEYIAPKLRRFLGIE